MVDIIQNVSVRGRAPSRETIQREMQEQVKALDDIRHIFSREAVATARVPQKLTACHCWARGIWPEEADNH